MTSGRGRLGGVPPWAILPGPSVELTYNSTHLAIKSMAVTIESICRFLSVPSEPLLALSRKVPAEVAGALAANPGAVGFLRKAAAALTEAEWGRLTHTLDRLRPPAGDQEPEAGLPESMRDLFWDHPPLRGPLLARRPRLRHRPHPGRRRLGLGDLAARAGRAGPVAPVADPAPVPGPGREADPVLAADPRPAGGPGGGVGAGGAGRDLGSEDAGLNWHPECLSPAQREVLGQLGPPLFGEGFYLASLRGRRDPSVPTRHVTGLGMNPVGLILSANPPQEQSWSKGCWYL